MEQTAVLSHKQLLAVDKDYKRAAKAANLIYVSGHEPGILRLKKGKGFAYLVDNKILKDKLQLERIHKLAIPPSWSSVWICADPNGHIQATGLDLNKRKQYRYHAQWNTLRNETKFHRLYEFGKALPRLRKKLKKDIGQKELTEEKVLAAVINLMEQTYIRIGSNGYEKLYGSYGLTTLKDKHVVVKNEKILFCFTGKKGIEHTISLKNKRLARIVKQCRDIPGKELFQYYDSNGIKKSIESGQVNNYIKEVTEMDFSAKDFRTWAGTLQALQCFCSLGKSVNETETKRNIVAVLDTVSQKLGNTRNICKKYYVHPAVIRLYEENKLKNIPVNSYDHSTSLSAEEKILMQVLKKYK
jgi:DNA topoisomerase-1